jgi:purine nucleosidase
MGDVPVVPGSTRPLLRPPLQARHVHGETGLGSAKLPEALSGPAPGHAVDFLVDTIGAAPGEITLIAVGPLTNIALALRREPALTSLVRDFVIMGGSAGRGNATPAAEFNMLADPEAAAIVFGAAWTVTMIGLDVTLQTRVTAAVRDRLRGLGRLAGDLLLPSLAGYRAIGAADEGPAGEGRADGGLADAGPAVPGDTRAPSGIGWPDDLIDPAVHDVCAVARVTSPGLISCAPALVEVETTGRLTSGMTVTDFSAPPARHNAMVGTGIHVDGFWDLVLAAYQRVAAGMASQ